MDPRVVTGGGTSALVIRLLAAVSLAAAAVLAFLGSGSAVLWGVIGLALVRLALRRCVLDGSTWHVRGFWRTHHVPVEELTDVTVETPMVGVAAHTVTVSFGQHKVGVAAFSSDEQAQEAAATMRSTLPPTHPVRAAR